MSPNLLQTPSRIVRMVRIERESFPEISPLSEKVGDQGSGWGQGSVPPGRTEPWPQVTQTSPTAAASAARPSPTTTRRPRGSDGTVMASPNEPFLTGDQVQRLIEMARSTDADTAITALNDLERAGTDLVELVHVRPREGLIPPRDCGSQTSRSGSTSFQCTSRFRSSSVNGGDLDL